MRDEMFKQCELTKPVDGGIARMVSWIPAKIAVLPRRRSGFDSRPAHRRCGGSSSGQERPVPIRQAPGSSPGHRTWIARGADETHG